MKRYTLASLFVIAAAVLCSDTASAQYPSNLGFIPYGFYQPYGARYGTSLRTPPYFALNPPVYYGARHSRPYGLSPFASPPLVTARGDYTSRLRSQFLQPTVPTPEPRCNPCISHGAKEVETKPAKEIKLGAVQSNPFVVASERIAKK